MRLLTPVLGISVEMLDHRTCLLTGWFLPLLVMISWTSVRLVSSHSSPLNCPFITDDKTDVLLYQLPIFCLLLLNTLFLVRIMATVLRKLQTESAGDVERRHYKAAKALVVALPLLGKGRFQKYLLCKLVDFSIRL